MELGANGRVPQGQQDDAIHHRADLAKATAESGLVSVKRGRGCPRKADTPAIA